MQRATYVTRSSMRLAKTRTPSTDMAASSSASQLRSTAAAALHANSQLHSPPSAGGEVESSLTTTNSNNPGSASFEHLIDNLDSLSTKCPLCPFTTTSSTIEFEGFNVIIHPCPCGEEHAHPATVLAHHVSSCSGKTASSNRPEDPPSLNAVQTIEKEAPPAAKRRRRRAPSPSRARPTPAAADLQPSTDGPDCANYAGKQRASPHVCITCTQRFTTRVHIFKNGRMHTPFMLYSCGCGERFSREYPNMRVRIDIKQQEHQALESDIELARERIREEFESAASAAVRERVRSEAGGWVLAKGVESEEEEEGEGDKEKPTYVTRAEMSGKWKQYAHERGMRRKISKLTCDICGEEFADLGKVATHRRVHQAAESEVEGRNTTCECGSVFRTKEGLKAHGPQCHLVRKDKRRNLREK